MPFAPGLAPGTLALGLGHSFLPDSAPCLWPTGLVRDPRKETHSWGSTVTNEKIEVFSEVFIILTQIHSYTHTQTQTHTLACTRAHTHMQIHVMRLLCTVRARPCKTPNTQLKLHYCPRAQDLEKRSQ